MKIYDDESINSYLFRCLHVYGINSFQSVIGNNGLWHSLPQAPVQLTPFLQMLPDMMLFNSLQREGYFNVRCNSRGTPLEIIALLRRVYGGSHKTTNYKGSIEVLFCQVCHMEMMLNYGHVYFRSEWKKNSNCAIHRVPLLNITGSNMKETVNNIIDSTECGELKAKDCNMNFYSYKNEDSSENTFVEPIFLKFLMPCTLDATSFFVREYYMSNAKHLRSNSRIYSDLFYSSFSPKMCGIKNPIMRNINEAVIYAALNELKNLDYKAWVSFHKHAFKIKEYSMGFNQRKSLTVTTVKSASANCSKCHIQNSRNSCVYDAIISKIPMDSGVTLHFFTNLCEQRIKLGFNLF